MNLLFVVPGEGDLHTGQTVAPVERCWDGDKLPNLQDSASHARGSRAEEVLKILLFPFPTQAPGKV